MHIETISVVYFSSNVKTRQGFVTQLYAKQGWEFFTDAVGVFCIAPYGEKYFVPYANVANFKVEVSSPVPAKVVAKQPAKVAAKQPAKVAAKQPAKAPAKRKKSAR